jgi:hypothetical protein
MTAVRQQLGEEAIALAYSEGQKLADEEAVAYTLASTDRAG